MNQFEIATLKDRLLKYLNENKNPCVSIAIYQEFKLEYLPIAVFNEYVKEMDLDDLLHINEMSGDRHLLFITDKGKRLLFEGGYVKKLRRAVKLHRIVEFLATESERSKKGSFNSGEIASAFTPALDIYEVNTLCKILIDEGDVRDCTIKDESIRKMKAVLVINATHDAYHTNKYLQEDEQPDAPVHQNISGQNVIVGNVAGNAIQENKTTNVASNPNGKTTWLNKLYWIIGIAVGLTVLIAFILKYIFF